MSAAAQGRAFLVVLDSVGIGGAPDAADFGDEGANTVGHIALACADGRAGRGPLRLPNLSALGLGAAVELASGLRAPGLGPAQGVRWGAATETSPGKDTPTGHWELAGVPVPWDWTVFEKREDSFPPDLVARAAALAGTDGILGNRHASGTNIIEEEGAEHMRTGWPICYTSTDSVFQIAAHEERFGLDRLLALCAALAPELHAMRVGRVIARPFTGTAEGGFERTANRKDFAIAPPAPTLCDRAHEAGREVNAVGKIGDIFSMRGIDRVDKGSDRALLAALGERIADAAPGSLTFANFVEFDSLYGHRRDVAGYAAHLEWFDAALPALLAELGAGDMLVITADHGNDPTWRGTDHTRERVPVLVHGPGAPDTHVGHCTFVDVAAMLAGHLGLPPRNEEEKD
ncbi:phosphopentomutase [Profundibacterium mesophilum]|uniref:Phosphopentomutase n=1 Tax=Profundibacterium mesophilum KAUST100406-0324 TaxID=1037889 RepID=A0A921NYW6_9RHOB|nr:phosphopentomutase [Profundibacterium mesophilum]KAF0677229.1 putative phosphopentomutase protein [Profundibacterium mesophilum KAUST100406-0324]